MANSEALPIQLVPSLYSGADLPPMYYEWVALGSHGMAPHEQPATELLATISRFVRLSSRVRRHSLVDGEPKTVAVVLEALQLDSELAAWETATGGEWQFSRLEDSDLPPAACFGRRYHIYSDVWIARVWNYYRWARILVGQTILESAQKYPLSVAGYVTATLQQHLLATIRRLAEDILVSIPSHWHHPALSPAQRDRVQSDGRTGTGATGVPATLFHLKTAGGAPGVPYEFWKWSVDALDTVWAVMGMRQAQSLVEVLRAHHDFRRREDDERSIVKCESP